MNTLKVIGLGDNVVDKYIYKNMMYPGGNSVNFSVYAKMLGADAAYMGIFGNDSAARLVEKVLVERGIDVSRCRHYEGENGYSSVDLIDGDRKFVGWNEGGVSKTQPLTLDSDDLEYLGGFDVIHTSCFSFIEPELPKLKPCRGIVSFDFSNRGNNDYFAEVCPHVDLSLISCGHMGDEEIDQTIEKIHGYGSEMVLASMGRRGAKLFCNGRIYYQKSGKEKAIDSMGAGDSFYTAFAVNYFGGLKSGVSDIDTLTKESLAFASQFATKICMLDGAFGCGIPIE